jgi:hypothetical protein
MRTTDHAEIKDWVESRGGRPAVVEGTFDELGGGVLSIDFGNPDEALEELTWRDFFRVFDDNELAFEYELPGDDGVESYVCTFVSRAESEPDESFSDSDRGVSDSF